MKRVTSLRSAVRVASHAAFGLYILCAENVKRVFYNRVKN
jgi:hypothetical protein